MIGPLRNLWLSMSAGHQFLDLFHSAMAPTRYDGLHAWLTQKVGANLTDVVGLLLLQPAVLGLYLFTLPIALSRQSMHGRSPTVRHHAGRDSAWLSCARSAGPSLVSRPGGLPAPTIRSPVHRGTGMVDRYVGAIQFETAHGQTGIIADTGGHQSSDSSRVKRPNSAKPRFNWGTRSLSGAGGTRPARSSRLHQCAKGEAQPYMTIPNAVEGKTRMKSTQLAALLDMSGFYFNSSLGLPTTRLSGSAPDRGTGRLSPGRCRNGRLSGSDGASGEGRHQLADHAGWTAAVR